MIASRGRAAALLTAVFLAGVLAGVGGAVLGRSYLPGPRRHRGPEDFVARLSQDLRLSPPQRDSVKAILGRRRGGMDSLWHEVGPRFETLQATVRSEIRAQLNPEQQRKFAEMNKRFDSMRRPGGAHAPR